MLKIGLTGGVGSGKSTAANYFAKLKVPIIDADKIAHELLHPTTASYKKIITHFGNAVLTPQNYINRQKLGKIIFHYKKERLWLEKLLHPKIRAIMQERATTTKAPYVILVIPLFFETKFPVAVDRVLVIDCPPKLQIERVRKRNVTSISYIQAIIKTQTSRGFRLKKAHDLIHNAGSLKELAQAVKKLHHYYLSLA